MCIRHKRVGGGGWTIAQEGQMIQMEQWRDSVRHNQLSDVVRFGPILDHAKLGDIFFSLQAERRWWQLTYHYSCADILIHHRSAVNSMQERPPVWVWWWQLNYCGSSVKYLQKSFCISPRLFLSFYYPWPIGWGFQGDILAERAQFLVVPRLVPANNLLFILNKTILTGSLPIAPACLCRFLLKKRWHHSHLSLLAIIGWIYLIWLV